MCSRARSLARSQAILDIAGTDGTEEFKQIHSLAMLEDFDPVGTMAGHGLVR